VNTIATLEVTTASFSFPNRPIRKNTISQRKTLSLRAPKNCVALCQSNERDILFAIANFLFPIFEHPEILFRLFDSAVFAVRQQCMTDITTTAAFVIQICTTRWTGIGFLFLYLCTLCGQNNGFFLPSGIP